MSLTQIEYPLLQTTYRDKYTDVEMAYSISNHRNGVYPSESSGRGRTFQVNPGSHKRVLNFALATDRASRVIFPLAFFIFNVIYWVTYVWLWLAWTCHVANQIPPLQWRHNQRYGVINHRHLDCLLSSLFRRTSKKTPKLRVAGLYDGESAGGRWIPLTKATNAEMFPFDDVIMLSRFLGAAFTIR